MPGCNFPEHHRGGGGFPVGLAVAVIVVVAIASTSTAARVASDLIEAILIATAALVVLTVAGVVLAVRIGRQRRRVQYRPPVSLPAARRQAIEAPRVGVPGVILTEADGLGDEVEAWLRGSDDRP